MATNLTTVNNLSNLPNLGAINFTANQITTLDLSNCPNLQEIRLGNNNLSTLNISNSPNASVINVANNPNLSILNIPVLTFCAYFNAAGCSLPTATIDTILVYLANQGFTGGYAFLDGGSNGIPTATGISAANYLTGDAGWTVTYNT